MADKKIALFIDADNVSAKFGKQIIDALSSRGEIFIRRVYGNWEKNTLHGWNECILNFSLRAVQQTDFVAGKNATDMSLTIDAMDVLYGGRANVFALVSNDSDFTPLAIRLREGGMNVVGLGNAHAANSFRAACSEFINLDAPVAEKVPATQVSKPARKKSASKENSPVQLSLFDEDKIVELKPPEKISASKIVAPVTQVQPVVKVSPAVNPKVVSINERQQQSDRDKKIRQVHELLSEVAKTHGDAEGFTPLCWAGQTLRKKNLGFGIRDVGYSSFQAFVKAFPDHYEMIHRTNGENYCFRCRTNSDGEIERLHDVLREVAQIHGDAQNFLLLNFAGQALRRKNLGFGVKDFGFNTLHDFVEAFPELYEIQRTGNTFSYRCRDAQVDLAEKIRQVHDGLREAVKIHADDTGFVNLCWTGAFLKDKNLDVKTLGYGALQTFIEAFPELYEVHKVGTFVSFRCRDAKLPVDDKTAQLHDGLREAWTLHAEADGFVNFWRTCEFFIKKNFPRELKSLTCKELVEFVAACPARYELRQDGVNDFSYRYRTSFDADRLRQLHDTLREAVKVHADDTGFADLSYAGNAIAQKNLSIKGFGHGTLQKFVASFPALYEMRTAGKIVRYRCR